MLLRVSLLVSIAPIVLACSNGANTSEDGTSALTTSTAVNSTSTTAATTHESAASTTAPTSASSAQTASSESSEMQTTAASGSQAVTTATTSRAESTTSQSSTNEESDETTTAVVSSGVSSSAEGASSDAAPDVACSSSGTLSVGDATKTVAVGGEQREFLIHVPASYSSDTPMPVVIDFHPLGSSGSGWKGANGWGTKADNEGFIMVWPTGIGNSWNVGMCCSTARMNEVDDVAFTRAIIASLSHEGCIDTNRVYATGCSNGGGMAYKVACEAADVIAAVAPVDFDCVVGPDAENACGICSPDRPISEIQFRGTKDTAVPYTGGPGPRAEVTFPGAEVNFSRWAEINACSGEPKTLDGHDGCMTYGECGSGIETTLCTVQNGSHCGSYGSFGIVDIAWERLKNSSL